MGGIRPKPLGECAKTEIQKVDERSGISMYILDISADSTQHVFVSNPCLRVDIGFAQLEKVHKDKDGQIHLWVVPELDPEDVRNKITKQIKMLILTGTKKPEWPQVDGHIPMYAVPPRGIIFTRVDTGRTPLHAAALLSQPELVVLLLAAGAEEVPDHQEKLRCATSINHQMFPRKECHITESTHSACRKDVERCTILVSFKIFKASG